MDPQAQAPQNLPFEPDDLDLDRELESIAPPAVPKVQSPVEPPPLAPPIPAPTAPPKPPANFLSGEPSVTTPPRPMPTGPKQPEDMFGGLDTSATRSMSRTAAPDPLAPVPHSYGKYILWICCLVAGLGALAAGLWYFAIHRPAQQAAREAVIPVTVPVEDDVTTTLELVPTAPLVTPPVVTPTPAAPSPVNGDVLPPVTTPPVTTPPPGTNIPPPTSVTPEPTPVVENPTTVFVDGDVDGLSDTREQELGTDPRNPDTDGDGLSDGNEVLKHGTNPLKTDTDGDTFSDGLEVKGGYNPRGPGKCAKASCEL